jgi:hypothetical protein
MKIPYLLHSVLRKIQEWIVVGPDQVEGPCSTPCSGHCPIGAANPKLYLVQDERERYGRGRDQHLGPEDIDMARNEGCVCTRFPIQAKACCRACATELP